MTRPADASRGHDRDQDLRENLEFAEELGAEVVRLEAPSVVEGIVEAAHRRKITHFVMAYEPAGRLGGLFGSSRADQLTERLPDGVELLLIGRGAHSTG